MASPWRSVASLPVRAYAHVPTWAWLGRRKGHRGLPAMNDCGAQNLAWLPSSGLQCIWMIRAMSTLAGVLRGSAQKLDLLRSSRPPYAGESGSRPVSRDPHRKRPGRLVPRFLISGALLASVGGLFRYRARATHPTDRTQSRPEARTLKLVQQILAVSTVNTWGATQPHSMGHSTLQARFRHTTRTG